MPQRKIDTFDIGGCDSRSNPTNFPPNRLLRCKNWVPLPSGQLRLRYGYTVPAMAPVGNVPIHSMAFYKKFDGTQFILFGQGNALNSYAMATGAVTLIKTLASASPWGYCRAGNRIFIGNGVDMVNFDGVAVRNTGIRSLTAAEAAAVTVTASAAPAGTWTASLLKDLSNTFIGTQLYAVIYNPVTGHVGNVTPIGSRVVITAGQSLAVAGLPNLSGENAEWVIGLGSSNDGGQVPYWLIDGSGNRVVVNSGLTFATLTSGTTDKLQELPTRNGVPLPLNRFTKVGGVIWGARDGDNFLYHTEDETDSSNGNFVGVTYESWAGNNLEAYPTGEKPLSVHAYRFEGWFFSDNSLSVFSNFLKQQSANPWRGPWPVGCCGQRGFVETPYGPFWLTLDKQLMSYDGSAPIPASEEYEAGLLGKIGDQYIGSTELAYLRDPEKQIDRLYILSKDKAGAPLVIIHDFKLKSGQSLLQPYGQSPLGQGYEAQYAGMVPNTLAGSGYTPRQNVRDLNDRERLWTGAVDGHFYQLEDGNDDNGHTYSGDAIGLINNGNKNTLVAGFEWQGDINVKVTYSVQSRLTLPDWTEPPAQIVGDPDNYDNRHEVNVGEEARWIGVRFQLDSHSADGNFDISDPPFVPIPQYGLINYVTAILGTPRPEGR